MRIRLTTSVLLIVCLNAHGAALTSTRQAEANDRLTEKESREAKELAVRFMARFDETDDAGPLVEEFFVKDFAERFQRYVADPAIADSHPVFIGMGRKVMLQTPPADLRRTYIAFVNFYRQLSALGLVSYDVTFARHNPEEINEQFHRLKHHATRDALSPAFFEICASDPLLALLVEFFSADELGATNEEDEYQKDARHMKTLKGWAITSVERLRSFTEKLERCVRLMSEAVGSLRVELTARASNTKKRSLKLDDVYRVDARTFRGEFFGFPSGTPIITARLFPYDMAMVRVDGKLKILGVLPDFDGD